MENHNIHYWIYPGLTYKIYDMNSAKKAVMNMFNITSEDFISRSRKRHLVEARYAYCYIVNKKLKYTLEATGKTLNRDHATVLHGVKLVKNLIMQDVGFKNKISILESNIESNNLNKDGRKGKVL